MPGLLSDLAKRVTNLGTVDLWRKGTLCIGAVEFEFEETVRDSAGRVVKRTIAGRDYEYGYDGAGRLVETTDSVDSWGGVG